MNRPFRACNLPLVRSLVVFAVLSLVRLASLVFYRVKTDWVGEEPNDPWRGIRLIAFLNHTSLFEPVFAGGVPSRLMWRIAAHGVVPAAEKTLSRPIVGLLFRTIARHVVSITRERDQTWHAVLSRIGDDSMVVILPEGRMMRRNGLDSNGKPMTVRGGIADILAEIDSGPLLVAYSGGLHHVQAPGEWRVGIFKTVRLRLEMLEIGEYRSQMGFGEVPHDEFKQRVRDDLQRRRDELSPVPPDERHKLTAGRSEAGLEAET